MLVKSIRYALVLPVFLLVASAFGMQSEGVRAYAELYKNQPNKSDYCASQQFVENLKTAQSKLAESEKTEQVGQEISAYITDYTKVANELKVEYDNLGWFGKTRVNTAYFAKTHKKTVIGTLVGLTTVAGLVALKFLAKKAPVVAPVVVPQAPKVQAPKGWMEWIAEYFTTPKTLPINKPAVQNPVVQSPVVPNPVKK